MSSSTNKDVKIAPGAVVCVESKLKGNITVGSLTVIHPKASLIAEAGPILIGENNIIEEQASIIHKYEDETKNKSSTPLIIGVNNVFEVGSEIYAKSIGDHNVFEPKCYVGPDVEIGNGCIIGAGCRVTVADKLPDQTVITGQQCIRSVALDKPPDSDDLARQRDELTAMSEIFTKEEFSSCTSNGEVHAIFEAHIILPSNFNILLSKDGAQTDFPICHLPPVRLVVYLPQDYPSKSCPNFTLTSCWLAKRKLNLLVEKLQKLWVENQCEILFIWCSFLKDQSLDLLNIVDHYDLNEKYPCKSSYHPFCGNAASSSKDEKNNNTYTYYKKRSICLKNQIGDEINFLRQKATEKLVKLGNDQLLAYQKESVKQLYFYLIEYNALKTEKEFKKSLQVCNVCFSHVLGELCKQLNCGHVTCIDCLKRMCEVHIRHGTMESIVCSEENCCLEIPANLIRELVTAELFDKFDRLMLNRTLDKISNMTYCPLKHCQYPVSTQSEDSLALCPNCNHAFCIFCKRAYHGIEGCRLKIEEKRELIEAYQNGDYEKRLELEKRYGKKQLTELVNDAQSVLWMSENSKKCPCCHINIEKNDGCNKMICRKCKANFCWMCLTRLSSLNPYLHFQDPKSKCFNLLFEGTYDELVEEDEDIEDDEDLEYDENNVI